MTSISFCLLVTTMHKDRQQCTAGSSYHSWFCYFFCLWQDCQIAMKFKFPSFLLPKKLYFYFCDYWSHQKKKNYKEEFVFKDNLFDKAMYRIQNCMTNLGTYEFLPQLNRQLYWWNHKHQLKVHLYHDQ